MNGSFPPVGAFPGADGACSFAVWAPLKKEVELLLGTGAIAMQPDAYGFWSARVKGVGAGDQYHYRIEGGKPLPDPASRFQPQGVHGPSEVVSRDFEWSDETWKGISLPDMVIYELHVGTFTPQGTFDGVVSRLPYLKELGVNTIELMPVSQFPGSRNWGYDGVFPFAAQNSYGGPAGLKNLVNQAHAHGIAVVLDVVYNHQGPEGNYFGAYAPYFTDRYRTFWGQAINFDDAYCDGVRHYYWQNALQWLDEFRLDGLRLDAVHAIWDFSAAHFIAHLAGSAKELAGRSGRQKVLIAEFDLNNPRYIDPPAFGGYGLSGQWVDEFHHALHALVTGERDGYYEDFGAADHLLRAYRDSYVYTGQYSVHRKKFFGVRPHRSAHSQFVVFAQNHDQVGNRMAGDRLTVNLPPDALRLVAAAYLLAPQVPMVFMGEEYGETNPFQYFISHTDTALVEAVRKGRREEFAYFKWKGEVPDPAAEETFARSTLSWDLEGNERRKLLALYKHLIALRAESAAIRRGSVENVHLANGADGRVIQFERVCDGEHLVFIFSFAKDTVPVVYSGNRRAVKIFDSASLQWGGPGELAPGEIEPRREILLHPYNAIVLSRSV